MQPFGVVPQALADAAGESDDVVVGDELQLVDALHSEFGVLAHAGGDIPGDDSQLGPGLGGVEFHLQPGVEFMLKRPKGRHFRAGIAFDHEQASFVVLKNCAGTRKQSSGIIKAKTR